MSDSGLEKFILDKLEKLDDKLDQVRMESTRLSAAFSNHDEKDQKIQQEIHDLSDRFCKQLEKQAIALHQYNEHLEEHMKRSRLLEESHRKMWERVEPVVQAYEEKEVVEKWLSDKAKLRLKWIAGVGTVAASLTAILKLMGVF